MSNNKDQYGRYNTNTSEDKKSNYERPSISAWISRQGESGAKFGYDENGEFRVMEWEDKPDFTDLF